MLAQRLDVEVVGLTSAPNVAFCEGLGCYDRVLSYEQLEQVAADAPCIYLDFAGNAALRRAVHTRFQALRYSCAIGGTHIDQLGSGQDLPGPRPTLFFAPAQARKRHIDWGATVFGQRLATAWNAYVQQVSDPAAPWLQVRQHQGPAALESTYQQVLSGNSDPRWGHIVSLR